MQINSIATKLLLAFSAIALLSLIAALVGLQGFQKIADTQSSVIDQAVPVLGQAHSLTQINTQVGALAQRLTEVTDQEDRAQVSRDLQHQIAAFVPLLDSIKQQGFAEQYLEDLHQTITEISDILTQQDDLVQRRNRERNRLEEFSARLVATTGELNELADSLVANAAATTTAIASNLYDLVEQDVDRTELFTVFDRLVEVDIDAMERMYELRLRSSNLSAIINRVTKETDPDELAELEREAVEIVAILARRIDEINDPQRKAQAFSLLQTMQLNSGPIYISNVFRIRQALLSVATDMEKLDQRYRTAAIKLNSTVSDLSDSGSSLMREASTKAKSSLVESRRLFIGIALVALLFIVFIVWRYIHRHIIRRLLALKNATISIASGKYDHEIETAGRDEVSQMAQALQLFRTNAIEKQRLDSELRIHKENLEKTVLERTAQLKQANEELAKEVSLHDVAREKAEKANRAKTDFLATISHELRTPLSGALGTLRLLSSTALTEKQREYLEAIDTANSVLLDILDNVLGYSQARAGKLEISKSSFRLSGLLGNIVSLMTAAVEEKGNKLVLDIHQDVPDYLHGDSGKLSQILLNLIGNAIKFTDDGEVRVSVTTVSGLNGEKTRLEFAVEDTGIGVRAEKKEEIFKAFTQADTSISRKYGGIGLGLSICKRLTEILDGEINLATTEGKGTCIRFSLPFEIASAADLRVEDQPLTHKLPSQNVLLVEDDATNRFVAKQYLELLRHNVLSAEDGVTALRMLDDNDVGVVLLDVSLPGMDGLAVIDAIRRHEKGVIRDMPVIAMSAHVFEEEVGQYLAAGMDGFLGKPFSVVDLERTMTKVVGGDHDVVSVKDVQDADNQLIDEAVIRQDLELLGAEKVGELVALFKESSALALDEIKAVMEANDTSEVKKIAHRLRSAAGNFGFYMLCNLLKEMESENQTMDDLHENVGHLVDQLSVSMAALDDVTKSLTVSQNT